MKNSLSKITQAVFCLMIILSLTDVTSGQTDSCSLRVGGGSGGIDGSDAFRINEWCTDTPGDVVGFQGTEAEFVCRGCLPGTRAILHYIQKGELRLAPDSTSRW